MTDNFDLIVLGTGSAGAAAAQKCRGAGWHVAIVDSRPFGGTCQLRGCEPKKILVGAATLIDWSRRMHEKEAVSNTLEVDWPALIHFKDEYTGPVPKQREQSFAEAGISTLHGRARFINHNSISVDGQTFTARYIIIATGARPRTLNIPGEELLTTSTAFLDLPVLPAHIVFIGGGFVSFEFAHVAARCGAHACILHQGLQPLEQFDADVVDRLVRASRDVGIEIHLNTHVTSLEKRDGGILVHANDSGKWQSFETGLAVHGAGRVPEIDDLDLNAARIEHTDKGIKVNEYLQSTSNPAIYAAGDSADAGGAPLTPVAGTEGSIVADNLLNGNQRKPNFSGLASIVYTIPPLAAVGLTETNAKAQGMNVRVKSGDSSGWYSSRRVAETSSYYKTLIDQKTDRLIGAHLLGTQAEEIINLFALAIRANIPLGELRNALYAYPTGASDIEYML